MSSSPPSLLSLIPSLHLQEAVAIWDAFSMPKMTYEPQTKSFAFTFDKRRKMNPDAGARCVRRGREGGRGGTR